MGGDSYLTCMATLMVLYPSCISCNGYHIGCHPFFTKADMTAGGGHLFNFREHGLFFYAGSEKPSLIL